MVFPRTAREVTVFKGRGRYAIPIGKVILDVADPDCFNWEKMLANKLHAHVTDGAQGATNPRGGLNE